MPPGLPRGSDVDDEAEAVGKLVPNLFLAHARARALIKQRHPAAQVGVNPLVTGFPTWLQMLMDWGACHRGLSEAVFKFTTSGALVSEKGDVDLVIGGITAGEQIPGLFSDPYLRTGKAVLVLSRFPGDGIEATADRRVGVIGIGNQPESWKRDLPEASRKVLFQNYSEARAALAAGTVDAIYGDAFYLMPGDPAEAGRFRFLTSGLSDEPYVVVAPNGHVQLLNRVNRAVARFQQEVMQVSALPWITQATPAVHEARRPLSLREAFFLTETSGPAPEETSEFRRIRRRGKIRIGLRDRCSRGRRAGNAARPDDRPRGAG